MKSGRINVLLLVALGLALCLGRQCAADTDWVGCGNAYHDSGDNVYAHFYVNGTGSWDIPGQDKASWEVARGMTLISDNSVDYSILGAQDYERHGDSSECINDTVHYVWTVTAGSATAGDLPDASICRVNLSAFNGQWEFVPSPYGGFDRLNLSVGCSVNDFGSTQVRDGSVTFAPVNVQIVEHYTDAAGGQMRCDFTIQKLDDSGNPVGPVGTGDNPIEVCPGARIRISAKNIVDVDHKVLEDVDIHPDGWGFKIEGPTGLIQASSDYIDTVAPNYEVDPATGKGKVFDYKCTLMDTSASNTGEFIDPDYVGHVHLKVRTIDGPNAKPGTIDQLGSGGCCGNGGFSVDLNHGTPIFDALLPGMWNGLDVCSSSVATCYDPVSGQNVPMQTAVWCDPCGNWLFFDAHLESVETTSNMALDMSKASTNSQTYTYEWVWECETDHNVKFKKSGNTVAITLASGVVYSFIDCTGSGHFKPLCVTFPDGKSYCVEYCDGPCGDMPRYIKHSRYADDPTPQITYDYHCNDPWPSGYPPRIDIPGAKYHILLEYGTGNSDGKPTDIKVVNNDNDAEFVETQYTYDNDHSGRLTSMTDNSGIKTSMDYTADDRVSRVYVSKVGDGPNDHFLKETDISYGTATLDGVPFGLTTVRSLATPGTATSPGVANDDATANAPTDVVEEHYYYQDEATNQNSYLRQLVTNWHQLEGGQSVLHKVWEDYTVDIDTGHVTAVTSHATDRTDVSTVLYEYYDSNGSYAVPIIDQHYLGDPADPTVAVDPKNVVYKDAGDIYWGDLDEYYYMVNGNGLVKKVTVTLPGGSSYSANCRYYVRNTNTGLVMTSDASLVTDDSGVVTKAVYNDLGKLAESYIRNDDNTWTELASAEYYGQNDEKNGRLKALTMLGISSGGESSQLNFDYAFNTDSSETSTVSMNGKSASAKVSPMGELLWTRNEQGRQTDLGHDWRSRLTKVTFPAVGYDGETEATRKFAEIIYNCCHVSEVKDEKQNGAHYHYDKWGRADKAWTDGQSETTPLVEYGFGTFGDVSTVTSYAGAGVGRTTSYTYDPTGLVTKVDYPEKNNQMPNGSESYVYDDTGELKSYTGGDGKVTTFDYLESQNVYTSTVTYDATSATPRVVTYTDDESTPDQTTTSTTVEAVGTSIYTYDKLGRLLSYQPPVPAGYGTIDYTWTLAGLKESMTVPDGSGHARKFKYRYDNEGRLTGTSVETVTITSSTTLATATSDGKMHFSYDDDANRVKLINKTGDIYYFVYDPTAGVPAVVYEQGPAKRYINVRDPEGALISRERYNSSGTKEAEYTYHFDGLGSTLALTDSSGAIIDKYSYDAWGNATHTYGSTSDNPYQFVGELGYYTHYQQAGFSLLQLGMRYYDPSTGRFTQQDPVGDGLNWYGYADGDPVNWVDPWGLTSAQSAKQYAGQIFLGVGDAVVDTIAGVVHNIPIVGVYDSVKLLRSPKSVLESHARAQREALKELVFTVPQQIALKPSILDHPRDLGRRIGNQAILVGTAVVGAKVGGASECATAEEETALVGRKGGSAFGAAGEGDGALAGSKGGYVPTAADRVLKLAKDLNERDVTLTPSSANRLIRSARQARVRTIEGITEGHPGRIGSYWQHIKHISIGKYHIRVK